MLKPTHILESLEILGAHLVECGEPTTLVVVGGAALNLLGVVARPTVDIDVLARLEQGKVLDPAPFSAILVEGIDGIARALDLPDSSADTPWFNHRVADFFHLQHGPPPIRVDRLSFRSFGALTLAIPCRGDLIRLKALAWTNPGRGAHRPRDLADLRALDPSEDELVDALQWCDDRDGGAGFLDTWGADLREALGFARGAEAP